MQAVGVAAGRLFAGHADPRVAACADDPPLPLDRLEAWRVAGRAWVAVDGHEVVGFAVVDDLDGQAHLEEIAVAPSHGRRGVGSALLNAVESAFASITLTTFCDVPWNRPWYEARGYAPVHDLTPALAQRVAEEAAAGLDPAIRVVLRKETNVGGLAGS